VIWRAIRPIAGVTIVALLFAACVPGFDWIDAALLDPGWTLLPDQLATWLPPLTSVSAEQPLPLQATASPRGPPAVVLA
jgi:hypothetical protein